MSRVKVKICGLTRSQDVDAAVDAGADAVGFVFASSPRKVTADLAARLTARVPASVLTVGLFMNHERPDIEKVLARVRFDLLQFHGAEPQGFCRSFGLPFLKAIAVTSAEAVAAAGGYPEAAGILFDSAGPAGAGGTGRTFDWSLLKVLPVPVWLAGGLDADNVARAIAAVRPDWVDVSSGVEDAPGIKSEVKMRALIGAVRSASVG